MASDNETVADIVREMRSGNYGCDRCGDSCDCPNADAIISNFADRIEKALKGSEKKYEYSVHPADVYGVFQHRSAAELNVNFFKAIGVRAHLIRREVGEWEEVKDA